MEKINAIMDVNTYLERIQSAVTYIQGMDPRRPETAIILGSGLGKLADKIENSTVIPYSTIPGFPVSTAIGHKGNLIIGELGGKTVIAMQGRFHYYEGYDMWTVTMPERVFSKMGIKYLFVSNAAGGLNESYSIGDLMLICDHLNFAPSPLIGPNLEEFGPRFPDMGHCYDPALTRLAEECGKDLGIALQKGVYTIVTGPTYETPAECTAYRRLGGDAIGMSTVPEVIVARHCGIKCLGVSIITDEAFGTRKEGEVIDGAEIVKIADAAADRMTTLFTEIIRRMEM